MTSAFAVRLYIYITIHSRGQFGGRCSISPLFSIHFFFKSIRTIGCRRAAALRLKSGWSSSPPVPHERSRSASRYMSSSSSSFSPSSLFLKKSITSTSRKAFLVDTLALAKALEAQGLPLKQAEAITSAITEVLNNSLESVAQSFVSKTDVQKSELIQDSKLSSFKSEIHSSQEHHLSSLQRATEKLQAEFEKVRSELRFEIDKVAAGQRLDLNLERGRIRDDLAKQNAETNLLNTKLEREIHAVKAHLEAAKYDLIKYCIGVLVSLSAVGLAFVRILM